MATLLSANLPSDDEEDEDFAPDEVDSEDEALKKKKRKVVGGGRRMRGAANTPAQGGSDGEAADSEPEGQAPIVPAHKRAEKKAKVEDMWAQMNKTEGKKPSGGLNLAALCKPASKKAQPSGGDSWLRQLGLGSTKPKAQAEGAAVDRKAMAAAALAAAKSAAALTAGQQYGTVTVTETRRFAGQNITIKREVAAGSKEAAAAAAAPSGGAAPAAAAAAAPPTTTGITPGSSSAPPPSGAPAAAAAAKKQAGLDAVLASLAQTKKVSVLDKTRSDWKEFKQGDDTVQEELEAHKRSGSAYLDRQAFLSRAEVAEYERERDQRLASDVRNRGRL